MNGVDQILTRILEEGRIAAGQITGQAELSARDILDNMESEAQFQRAAILDKAKLDAEDEKKRMESLASLEVRKNTLQKKQELLSQAFDKALERLNTLPREEYVEVVCRLLLPYLKTGEEEIVLSADKETGELFLAGLRLKLVSMGNLHPKVTVENLGDGGFLVRNGDIELNCTFSALMRQLREQLEQEVAKVLF